MNFDVRRGKAAQALAKDRPIEEETEGGVHSKPERAEPEYFKPERVEPELPPPPDSGRIVDDRQLLESLGLNDAEAAMILTKSRQALNNQLGPKKAEPGRAPNDYFRLGEIALLTAGARQLDRTVNMRAVKYYVATTRPEEVGGPAYAVLTKLLDGEAQEIDLAGANTIVFLLPAFADLRASRGDVAMNLLELANSIPDGDGGPDVFVLSSTEMQARMAGQWLGLDNGSNCFGRDVVDHYLPTVLVYRREGDEPRPYVLTERGTFEAAPRFRSAMIADCVRSMMPSEMRGHLMPEGPLG